MFDERNLYEPSQRGESSSSHHDSPQQSQHYQAGTFSLDETNYEYKNPTYSQRTVQRGYFEDQSDRQSTSVYTSPELEHAENWRPVELVALPSRWYNPNQQWNLPGTQSMPSYPLHAAPPPPPSEFFTILAQYHAYAINRAQETKQRRNESIKKYREKKRRRNSSSRVVKYQMRKELADRRIRGPRGRFIRKEEENRILESQQAPLELNESTREQSSPEPTAPLDTFLQQQQREAFVSPLCCISHHRKPHRSNLFTETLGSYSPPWHYFS